MYDNFSDPCAGVSAGVEQFLPHPTDCHQYIYCVGDLLIQQVQCQGDQVYIQDESGNYACRDGPCAIS